MSRLPPIDGEIIDRNRAIDFQFEGEPCSGFAGDTISSALAASGVTVFGRSFKYHRPRGLLSVANHDVNAMVQVRCAGRSVPNVRADVVPVQPGWDVRAVNTRGSLRSDRLSMLNHLSPFLPVGFYYKAFHSKRWFPRWERMFRNLAGLGSVDLKASRQITPKRYDFCDVLVVGAGPSGLAAALAAADQRAAVLLVDENQAPGGSGLYARGGDSEAAGPTNQLVARVHAHARIRLLSQAYAAGYYADHWVPLIARECMIKVRARAIVVAQGGWEQPAVFRGNDLPGVMLASAAQRLLYRHAVVTSRRIAVLSANAEGYAAALDALAHGVDVAAVLDLRGSLSRRSRPAAEELMRRGVALQFGVEPIEASTQGGQRVGRFEYTHAAGADGRAAGSRRTHNQLSLDGIWMSVGFAPANALLQQTSAQLAWVPELGQFVPQRLPDGIYACGKINGVFGLGERMADGADAGACAAAALSPGGARVRASAPTPAAEECPTHAYPIFPHPKGKEFVDFDEDLHIRDIENACQEGFDSSELLKRFSTIGMGPSQGKHSHMNALRILARVRNEPVEQLGMTTARPMFYPVPLSHLAGRGFTPERRTPLDAEHAARGAVWMPAGNWRRPEYYATAGRSRSCAIAAEVTAVRTRVGLIDVGTLGKIEVHGPDAGEFLDRVYTARFSNLKIGMTRYALMLDEAGVIIDDGVVGRLGAESFYFTTTTGNSATLFREFGRLATWWGLSAGLVNLTGHYGAFNLAGPAARVVLCQHTGLDLDDAAFPYLGLRQAEVAGVRCRILRVGFVGELGYEIHCEASQALKVWRALCSAGERYDIRPFGVEAQRMLRLEKGHLIVGQDTDGLTNALEIDAGWALKMDKAFFVGQRSLKALERLPRRQQLVGFSMRCDAPARPRECHLVLDGADIAGRVTSTGSSPTLNRCIGLALVTPSVAAGKRLRIRVDAGEIVEAEIVKPPFYDPAGDRQRVVDPA
jgi:sarcosine oxidase subunit alpha